MGHLFKKLTLAMLCWAGAAGVMHGTAATAAGSEKITIKGEMGSLSAIVQKPVLAKGEKCPLVILMHGFSGNKDNDLIRWMADSLQQAGIASLRFDFDGHGESEGEFVKMTVPREIEDARRAYKYAAALPYVSRIALMGHSQGGVVAGMLAGKLGAGKVAAVVLFAPAASLRDDALRGSSLGATYDAHNVPPYVDIFGLHLGRDYILTAQTLPIYETTARYTGPVCLLHGLEDRVVNYSYSNQYKKVLAHCTLHLLEGEDHGFSRDPYKAVHIAVSFLKKELQ